MAFRTESCVLAVCDLCGYVLDEDSEGIQHYATEADALKWAKGQGWSQLADERLVCDSDEHATALAADAAARFEAVTGLES